MFAVIFFSTLGCILAWIRDIPKIKSKKILARSLYIIGIINVIISYVLIKNILFLLRMEVEQNILQYIYQIFFLGQY
ncbi:membrane protein [Neisseria meningitidis]|nr:membrane protein [Neisseria meningitidis]CWS73338.1 membrane protein [Neisseria meningitidis]